MFTWAVGLLVLALLYAAFVVWLLVAGRREDARALAGFIPDCIVVFRRLLRDERVPRRSKLLLAGLVGYLALPFDLVPDFIPVAGQLDDAIIVAFVLRTVLRASGPDLLREHWPGPAVSLNALLRLAGEPRYGRRVERSVKDNPGENRFELWVDGELVGRSEYLPAGDSVIVSHTEIDERREGEGLGGALVRGTLDAIRERGQTVIPTCSFTAEYIRRHPEYVDLVDPSLRDQFGSPAS